MDVSAKGKSAEEIATACEAKGANVRVIDDATVGLSFGESIYKKDVVALVRLFCLRRLRVAAYTQEVDPERFRTSPRFLLSFDGVLISW